MKLIDETLERLARGHNLRRVPEDTSELPGVVDLSSNDYLGLATREDLRREFFDSLGGNIPPLSASASRLLAARQHEHSELEALLRELYGRPVLLFNSGYHANVGIISALASSARTLVVADRLSHASILDGTVLSRASFERFRHNDAAHLDRILAAKAAAFDRVLIVTESVFSMDGDTAPLEEIAAVKRRYANALLYVDEAHAFGVEGRQGLGLVVDMPEVDIIIGTLGKAAASAGAFAVCRTEALREFLLNCSRSFIFSTALPPFNAAWSTFLIKKIMRMDAERAQLRHLASLLADAVGGDAPAGHIRPLIVGSSEGAIALSQKLRTEGFKVLPIRTPTVPPGTERLRFSLSLDVTEADLIRLKEALK